MPQRDIKRQRAVRILLHVDGGTLEPVAVVESAASCAPHKGLKAGVDFRVESEPANEFFPSWNCGAEGPTDDHAVEKLRDRQRKNFLTITMLSLGVPMILMGDEARRSQLGNNNAYCRDNETSWFDWTLITKHTELHRLVKLLILGDSSETWNANE